jgi:hypothetical protein
MVFVATGSDDQNIRTAVNLRIIIDRIGINPKIQAVVKDDLKAEMVSFNELKNYHEDNYDIKFVGNIKSLFTYENILCPQLEEPARKLHIMWTDSIKNKKTRQEEIEKALKSFEQYEYYRRSSTSSAIHEKWYTKCGMYDSDISDVEHKRWNVYMRTEGYKFSGSIDKRTRKDRAKLHNLLVPIDQLPPEEVEKDVKTNSKTMKERG